MKASTPRDRSAKNEGGRVSSGRELAVVTLGMLASIAGVGGLLAAGHQPAGAQAAASPPALSSPANDHRGGTGGSVGAGATPTPGSAASWSSPSQHTPATVSRGS